ncbi:uncharacterized protein LOC121863799 isoform X2 [Homarus americanus]|nr:uncharacterized protein LOC121863799 isoform X2 [Homarus americanus]
MSQLRQKIKELGLVKREKEAIIFRRTMRQVPRDELDLLVSRIAAYNKEEFSAFMQNLQKEEKECVCGKGELKPVKTESLSRRIRSCVRGERVNTSSDSEAQALRNMLGKQGERITYSAEKVRRMRARLYTKKQDEIDLENQNASDRGYSSRHASVENSRYQQDRETRRRGKSVTERVQKSKNNTKDLSEYDKPEEGCIRRDEKRSVFSRLGIRKRRSSPIEKSSEQNVTGIDKCEKQKRRLVRAEVDDRVTHLSAKQVLLNSSQHSKVQEEEPKDKARETLIMNKDYVVEGDVQFNVHKESIDNYVTNEFGLKDTTGIKCLAHTDDLELPDRQFKIRKKGKTDNFKANTSFDISENDEDMLRKSLFGQRMAAKLENMRKPQISNDAHSVSSFSAESSTVNYGSDSIISKLMKLSNTFEENGNSFCPDVCPSKKLKERELIVGKNEHCIMIRQKKKEKTSHSDTVGDRRLVSLFGSDIERADLDGVRSDSEGCSRVSKMRGGNQSKTEENVKEHCMRENKRKDLIVEKEINSEIMEKVINDKSKRLAVKNGNDAILTSINSSSVGPDVKKNNKETVNLEENSNESAIVRCTEETTEIKEELSTNMKKKGGVLSKASKQNHVLNNSDHTMLSERSKESEQEGGPTEDAPLRRRSKRILLQGKCYKKSDENFNQDESNDRTAGAEQKSEQVMGEKESDRNSRMPKGNCKEGEAEYVEEIGKSKDENYTSRMSKEEGGKVESEDEGGKSFRRNKKYKHKQKDVTKGRRNFGESKQEERSGMESKEEKINYKKSTEDERKLTKSKEKKRKGMKENEGKGDLVVKWKERKDGKSRKEERNERAEETGSMNLELEEEDASGDKSKMERRQYVNPKVENREVVKLKLKEQTIQKLRMEGRDVISEHEKVEEGKPKKHEKRWNLKEEERGQERSEEPSRVPDTKEKSLKSKIDRRVDKNTESIFNKPHGLSVTVETEQSKGMMGLGGDGDALDMEVIDWDSEYSSLDGGESEANDGSEPEANNKSIAGNSVNLSECVTSKSVQKPREPTLTCPSVSQGVSEGKQKVLNDSQKIGEEIKLRESEAIGHLACDESDSSSDESYRDREHCVGGDNFDSCNDKRFQRDRGNETTRNHVPITLHQASCREREKMPDSASEMKGLGSDEEGLTESNESHQLKEKDSIVITGHTGCVDAIQQTGDDHIDCRKEKQVLLDESKINAKCTTEKLISNEEEIGGGSKKFNRQESKDSVYSTHYTEESIFPQEEELLYDGETDDNDDDELCDDNDDELCDDNDDELCDDTNEVNNDQPNDTCISLSGEKGATMGSKDGDTEALLLDTNKHCIKGDFKSKNSDSWNEKEKVESSQNEYASEPLHKKVKRKSVHERLSFGSKEENSRKRIPSSLGEKENDHKEKTSQDKSQSKSPKHEKGNLDKKWTSTPSPSRKYLKDSSPQRESHSVRLGRIRRTSKEFDSKHIQESLSPLMSRENKLQSKKNMTQEPSQTKEERKSHRTRISRGQRERTEKADRSSLQKQETMGPLMLIHKKTERIFASQHIQSNSPTRIRETKHQSQKNEGTTHRNQKGCSPLSKDERVGHKRKKRQENLEEELPSQRRRVLVKSCINRPAISLPMEEEKGKRMSNRLRKMSCERKHRNDISSNLLERGSHVRVEKRRGFSEGDELDVEHNSKKTLDIGDVAKSSSTKKIPVDTKLLQSILSQSPSKFSEEGDEKEEGELDDDDMEETHISETTKFKTRSSKISSKEKDLKHWRLVKERRKTCKPESKWISRPSQVDEAQYKEDQHVSQEEKQTTRLLRIATKLKESNVDKKDGNKIMNTNADKDVDKVSGREDKIKPPTDSSEKMKTNLNRTKKAKYLRNSVEDEATFYPTDLFQVVKVQIGSSRMTSTSLVSGPALGSDDTIDMIVKRHNEKYASDNNDSSDNSEMSLLQFITDESEMTCKDNGENEMGKGSSIVKKGKLKEVDEDTVGSRGLFCEVRDIEENTDSMRTKDLPLKTANVLTKSQVTGPRCLKRSGTQLSLMSPTCNVKDADSILTSIAKVNFYSNNSDSIPVSTSISAGFHGDENDIRLLGGEERNDLYEGSSHSESPHSIQVTSELGEGAIDKFGTKHETSDKSSDLDEHCSNNDSSGEDEFKATSEKENSNAQSIVDGSLADKYEPQITNGIVYDEQGSVAATSPSTCEEITHFEDTEVKTASEIDDSSSSNSGSDSDCECSKCASSSSSSSCSSASDTDSEVEITDLFDNTDCNLDLHEEIVNKLNSNSLINCSDTTSCDPNLSDMALQSKSSHGSPITISQRPKSPHLLSKTPKKSPCNGRKSPSKLSKTPHKSPKKAYKSPSKKAPHKSPSKKTPRKTPCKKTPLKVPCKEMPNKSSCRKTPKMLCIDTIQKFGKITPECPNADSTISNMDGSIQPLLGVTDMSSQNIVVSGSGQVKTITSNAKFSHLELDNTGGDIKANSVGSSSNISQEILQEDHNKFKVPENTMEGVNDNVNIKAKSCDQVVYLDHKAVPTSKDNVSVPLIESVFQRRRRKLANFGTSIASEGKLSCVNVQNVISVVHSDGQLSVPPSHGRSPTKTSARTTRNTSPSKKTTTVTSEATRNTAGKAKEASSQKRQRSPTSYISEKVIPDGKKMRILSPEMFHKVSNRSLFSDINKSESLIKSIDELTIPVKIHRAKRAKRRMQLVCSNSTVQSVLSVTSKNVAGNNLDLSANNISSNTTPKNTSDTVLEEKALRRSPRKMLKFS